MKRSNNNTFYPYVIDYKPGFFLNRFLYGLFKRVSLDENMKEALKQMHRQGTVVYASKYGGLLDYLLYHYNYRRRRLPYPKIAFDLNISLVLPITILFRITLSQISAFFRYGGIPSPYKSGFYSKAIQEGTSSLISLVNKKGFVRAFIHSEKDHLTYLIETQLQMDRPIFIVPQLLLYKQTQEKDYLSLSNILFGYKDHPGIIRKIVLFARYYRSAVIDFGSPVNLKTYLEKQPSNRPIQDMAAEIRQVLIESIDKQKRIVLGPIMKSRQQFREIVLVDQEISDQIEKMANGDKKKRRQLRKKAGDYFDEIAADPNTTYVHIFRMALKWLWKRVFDGIDLDQENLGDIREWARKGPMIYIPSHKSHIDYLALNYALYDFHMHIPRVVAGKNLAFWPMGHIFRKSGAFFIRRSFRGARLYSAIFTRYVKALLEDGHPIEFYIEGGRSRNGKLVLPKIGFLSILLQAYQEGFCKDLVFVPTSIIYDRIIEEKSYLKELGDGTKEKESFAQMLRARRFLKRRYGKIYIRFSKPISLNEYLSQRGQEAKDSSRDLAFHLIKAINEVSLVTPLALIGSAILVNHRKGFHISELTETAEILLRFLTKHNVPLAATLNNTIEAVQNTISLLINWKIVDFMEDITGGQETFYFVDNDKKMELEYYKNSIIHFFIHHAFVAVSLLTGKDEVNTEESVISDYRYMKTIFVNEFVFDEDSEIHDKVLTMIRYFLDSGFLTHSEGDEGYRITKLGFDKLPIWAALARTFLESYWIAAKAISQQKDRSVKGESLLKNMIYLGNRFHKLGVVEHIGALSRINFRNATDFFNKTIVNSQEVTEEKDASLRELSRFSKRLYELSHYGR